jgi:hypothetical protein
MSTELKCLTIVIPSGCKWSESFHLILKSVNAGAIIGSTGLTCWKGKGFCLDLILTQMALKSQEIR